MPNQPQTKRNNHKNSSVLTIALTLGVVYGLAVVVYQHGGLDALGIRSLSQVRFILGVGVCIHVC